MAATRSASVDDGPMNKAKLAVAAGGALILVGCILPWAYLSTCCFTLTVFRGSLSAVFVAVVLVTGCLALVCGVLAAKYSVSLLPKLGIAITAILTISWGLFFPATVFLGARNLVGYANAPAATGPTVTYGAGAWVVSLGLVLIVGGSALATTRRRWVHVVTLLVAAILGVTFVIGFA